MTRALLTQQGWTESAVNEAFAYLRDPRSVQPQPALSSTSAKPSKGVTTSDSVPGSVFNVFSYRGRIGRMRYVLAALAVGGFAILIALGELIVGTIFIVQIISTQPAGSSFMGEFVLILVSAAILPYLLLSSVIVKRFHDLGKSGTWWFSLLVPVYNIYLALELCTRRGTIGPNEYGFDPLPSGAPDSDLIDRFIGKSATGKICIALLLFSLSLVGRLFVDRPNEQQRFDAAVSGVLSQASSSAVTQPTTPDLALPVINVPPSTTPTSTSSIAQVAQGLPANWKTILVSTSSSSGSFCYRVNYPLTLEASPYGAPGEESFLQQGGNGSSNGVVIVPDLSDTYTSLVAEQEGGPGAKATSFTTGAGIVGTEILVSVSPTWQIWGFYAPFMGHGTIEVLPANRMEPFDPGLAETIAESLTFSCGSGADGG